MARNLALPATASNIPLKAGLYVVATPIGNLGDITLRALEILRACDIIACEDTRTSRKLLQAYSIDKPLTSYHDYSNAHDRLQILDRVSRGQAVALISDAGTPLISDPGFKLVHSFYEAGLPVTCAPGPCSVIAGLVLSGMPTDRFMYAGFAEPGTWHELASLNMTLVFLESARRLPATLEKMAGVFASRQIAVVREITKMFEETRFGSPEKLAAYYKENGLPKGEIVLVLGPPATKPVPELQIETLLREALPTHSLRDACTLVAGTLGISRRKVYQYALEKKMLDQ